ncbi:hypothetical protein Glove_20g27 [Diversispora epigaea]|uniref:Uncharacterized protein n=1 Tax=Diversispora epigaea TaxID=1348612 RepID=A0A397JUJ3_9GLOM|nr:hypothetical protein Glove_20g27 [Diversispora epigaea]
MIIDIDNHITSFGSYYQFQKWLKELSKHEELLPEGLLFFAFDNEQKEQKNYLDRGSNTVIFHIVTKIFDISPQIQDTLDKELYNFLFEIVYLLSEEKSSITNIIDSLIASTGTNVTNMKQCPNCHQKNIKNQKQTCPKYKTRLPILAKIQKEKVTNIEDKSINHLTISTMPLTFKSCNFNNNESIAIPSNEIVDEIQLMQLHPEIREIIEKYYVVSRSGICEQHQGLNTIIKEVNKALKTLIPSVPQHHH